MINQNIKLKTALNEFYSKFNRDYYVYYDLTNEFVIVCLADKEYKLIQYSDDINKMIIDFNSYSQGDSIVFVSTNDVKFTKYCVQENLIFSSKSNLYATFNSYIKKNDRANVHSRRNNIKSGFLNLAYANQNFQKV